jgi:hypothetical protein
LEVVLPSRLPCGMTHFDPKRPIVPRRKISYSITSSAVASRAERAPLARFSSLR